MVANQPTRSSKSRVKRDPARANGTAWVRSGAKGSGPVAAIDPPPGKPRPPSPPAAPVLHPENLDLLDCASHANFPPSASSPVGAQWACRSRSGGGGAVTRELVTIDSWFPKPCAWVRVPAGALTN